MCCGQSENVKTVATVGVGSLLATFGLLFAIYWPGLFNSALENELILSPHSKSFQMWEVLSIPVYIEFYFFNWTNPEELEITNTGSGRKPNLVELGPYVFREYKTKIVDGWHPENHTITFRQNKTWIFEPSRSNGSLDDIVQTINIPAISAAFASRNLDPFLKVLLNHAMQLLDTRYFVKKKVREFLFDGYEDPLLDLAGLVPKSLTPVMLPLDKFGWFYKKNGSSDNDGIFNMKTGSDDIENIGKLLTWNYSNKTKMYESYCGKVNGSAGEIFPPRRDRSNITFFSPDICRSLTLSFKEEINFEGIWGYRFWGDENLLFSQTEGSNNSCWCPSGECPPRGALDVSTCKFGSPAFVSLPHFLHADPSYSYAVTGMDPREEDHQMFIDLEPNTGIPIQVSAAFQINVLLQPQESFTLFNDVPKIYFPALWFRQTAQIDHHIGLQLKLLVALPVIGLITSYTFLIVGLLVIKLAIICRFWKKFKDDRDMFDPQSREGAYDFSMKSFPIKFSLTPLINSTFRVTSVEGQKLKLYK